MLKDTGEISTQFGQVLIAGVSIADVATVVLLSLFFSGESSGLGAKVALLVAFAAFVAAIGLAVAGAEHSRRLSTALLRLQDTTAQIRVRAALLLRLGFAVVEQEFGLEAILGAFLAGATIKLVDRDIMRTHEQFRVKLEAVGFGVFVPFFFVASGIRFDGGALFGSAEILARVPLLVALLLLVRGLPALLYARLVGRRLALAAGLLQATTLSFPVVASQLGVELGLLSPANAAAIVAAALVSVIVFPVFALGLLSRNEAAAAAPAALRLQAPAPSE